MRRRLIVWMMLGAVASLSGCAKKEEPAPVATASPCDSVNVLSDAEKAAGWELLFDGKTLTGWHGFNGQSVQAWKIEDCLLKTVGTEGNYGSDKRADLVTDRAFENFEISIDWKTSKGGNSGIMYAVVEDPKYEAPWVTGPEYQFIDEVGFPEKLEDWQLAGADYAMHPPSLQKDLKPVGEWNTTRIIVNGTHVEYWLNSSKTVDFERWTPEWKKLRETGKWKEYPDYGIAKTGKIAIQDHGSVFWFRNIKLRRL